LLFIQTTAALRINDRVDETMGIIVELEITSQVSDFLSQILSFLAYGGSSVVNTLDQTSFHQELSRACAPHCDEKLEVVLKYMATM
jgi:hypothetical protein